MAGHDRVWITRREDIARHWMVVHSYLAGARKFGGVAGNGSAAPLPTLPHEGGGGWLPPFRP